MATHRIASTPETVRWGMFDAGFPPLIDDRLGRYGGAGMRLRRPGGDAAAGLRLRPSRPRWRRSMPPTSRARRGHIITGPVGVSPAPSRATCWKCGSTRSSSAPTGATAASARWPARCRRIFPRRFLSHIPVDRDRTHLPAALGHRTDAGAVLRRDGRGAAAGLRHASPPSSRASMAATSTTRNSARARRCSCRSGRRARCSPPATATACRATARSASTRWKSA